ncbi:MAG: hypothetical protein M0R80_13895 [Proteobacteria bacterium]|jgi:hypothetical protein|nr:hypothetical protein [Pseudomonadota bacterium]
MAFDRSFEILSDGSPVLTLGDACIQTAAKRAHRRLSAALLEDRAGGEPVGAALETLARFLSTTDFASLRAEHAELAGGTPGRVRLWRDRGGAVRWEVERSP